MLQKKELKIVNVAIGALVEYREGVPWLLITRRREDAVLGGYWELPGGKLERDETPDACVHREFREELGIEVVAHEPLSAIEHVYEHAHVRIHPYLCRHRSGQPQNLAVAEHRWIEPVNWVEFRFPAANRGLMQYLAQRL